MLRRDPYFFTANDTEYVVIDKGQKRKFIKLNYHQVKDMKKIPIKVFITYLIHGGA